MVDRLCLDTSAYSRFKRGVPRLVDVVRGAHWIGVPTVVLGELRTGFALGRRADANEAELEEFLAQPVVHVLDIDDVASRHYARLVVTLRKRGTPIPTNDLWIASAAMREAATVLTCDVHFRTIEELASLVIQDT